MYIKLLNKNELHYDFQYTFGKNTCQDFRRDIDCNYGLHFTDDLNFVYWLRMINKKGHFREVVSFENMIENKSECKYKAESITLGPKRNISELLDTFEKQKLAVTQDGNALKYIENPSFEIQKLAVTNYGYAIEHIQNPSFELQKLAVTQNGLALEYIQNPFYEIQKLAVTQDERAIIYIENPSEEIKQIFIMDI